MCHRARAAHWEKRQDSPPLSPQGRPTHKPMGSATIGRFARLLPLLYSVVVSTCLIVANVKSLFLGLCSCLLERAQITIGFFIQSKDYSSWPERAPVPLIRGGGLVLVLVLLSSAQSTCINMSIVTVPKEPGGKRDPPVGTLFSL